MKIVCQLITNHGEKAVALDERFCESKRPFFIQVIIVVARQVTIPSNLNDLIF